MNRGVAAVVSLLLTCSAFAVDLSTDKPTADFSNHLNELPEGASTLFSAKSWDELVRLATPTFAWDRRDMMWIRYDDKGKLRFQLDEAVVVGADGQKQTFALINFDGCRSPLNDLPEFLRETAPLMKTRPQTDGGPGTHALLLSRQRDGSELYDVAWQSQTMGTGLYYRVRHLFVLHDAQGAWRFAGEGPTEEEGHQLWSSIDFAAHWTSNLIAPLRISFSVRTSRSDVSKSAETETELVTLREGALSGAFSAKCEWLDEEHHVATAGETFDSIVLSIAEWRGNYRKSDADGRKVLTAVERLLVARNPFLIHRVLLLGTSTYIPDYGEICAAVALPPSRGGK